MAEAVEPGPSSTWRRRVLAPATQGKTPAQCLADSSLEYFIHLVRQWAGVRRADGLRSIYLPG